MIYCLRLFSCVILCFIIQSATAQKSPAAKKIYEKALADSAAKKYTEVADEFFLAGKEELKIGAPDILFIANCFYRAGLYYEAIKQYAKAHEVFYLSMEQYRIIKRQTNVSKLIKAIAELYQENSGQTPGRL